MSTKSKKFSKKVDLPIPQNELWDLLSNTEHLNRTLGLPNVEYDVPLINQSGAYRQAKAKVFNLLELKWKENFFEWVKPDFYSISREFSEGPFSFFQSNIKLSSNEKGTSLNISIEIQYKEDLATPLISAIQTKGANDLISYCNNYQKIDRENNLYILPTKRPTNVNKNSLETLINDLKKNSLIRNELIDKLKVFIENSSDELISSMRPFNLADIWNENRRETLKLFLYATQKGLLNLKWALLCPNCRVPKAEYNSLKNLLPNFHCDLCGIDYEADLDRYTEAKFSVSKEIRNVKNDTYCIGSPSRFPHILAQMYIKPNEKKSFSINLEEEPIRIRTIKYNQVSTINPSDNHNGEIFINYSKNGWEEKERTFKPGKNTATIHNNSNETILVVLEKVNWDSQIASALYITSMQEFRKLFGSEVLSKDEKISIQNICILFTDLKSSTSLYETIGDAPAYGHVKKHFDFLSNIIQENNGSIVKTIGDAVMAVFYAKKDVIKSALDIQSKIEDFNTTNKLNPPIIIKLGVHCGPAIAVNANEVLDYFGRTVNIASRIQKESEGGDVVIAKQFLNEPTIQETLKAYNLEIKNVKANLKDIEGDFELCKIVAR